MPTVFAKFLTTYQTTFSVRPSPQPATRLRATGRSALGNPQAEAAASAGRFFSQNISFSANWIWREVVAVPLMTPAD
jgi:hypothetical protein